MSDVRERLAEIEPLAASRNHSLDEVLDWLLDLLQRGVPEVDEPSRELTASETEVLLEEGIDPDVEVEGDPIRDGARAYLELIEEALTAQEAAEVLGRSPSRVRQMLANRQLYGVKLEGDWRLPRWQFTDGGVVPNLGEVVQRMDSGLHPLTVQGFLMNPQPELQLSPGSKPQSPLDWLAQAGDPEPVAALAADL